MKIEIIAAINNKRAIGYRGGLPWPSLKEDMALFKRLTWGHVVIMGRKTWASLPASKRPLPGRVNVVLSRDLSFAPGDAWVVRSLDVLIKRCERFGTDKVFIIGGAQVYEDALKHADVLHLSLIDDDHDGDVFFPQYNPDDWREVERVPFEGFTYLRLERI